MGWSRGRALGVYYTALTQADTTSVRARGWGWAALGRRAEARGGKIAAPPARDHTRTDPRDMASLTIVICMRCPSMSMQQQKR